MKFKTTEELKHVPFEMYARAEAQLAEAKTALTKYGDVGAFNALRDANARAEQAEAQLAEARAELASNKLVIDQLAHERNGAESELKAMRELVSKQAEDEGLWFVPVSITEDYLQRAIRALHEAIEGKSSSECARAALATSPAEREG